MTDAGEVNIVLKNDLIPQSSVKFLKPHRARRPRCCPRAALRKGNWGCRTDKPLPWLQIHLSHFRISWWSWVGRLTLSGRQNAEGYMITLRVCQWGRFFQLRWKDSLWPWVAPPHRWRSPGSIKKKATCFMSVETTSFCFPHPFPVRADWTPSKNETNQSSCLKLLFSRIFAIIIRKLTNIPGGKERGREIKQQLCISKHV